MNVYGELVRAQFENLSVDPSAGQAGRVWLNTASGVAKLDKNGSTQVQFIDSSVLSVAACGYLNTVTSDVQTQINALSAAGVVSLANTAATYTITDVDGYGVFLLTAGVSNRTITLPTASANTNRKIVFKKVDSGVGQIIVDGEGAETIDGVANFLLVDQDDYVAVVCSGTEWVVVEKGIGSRVVSIVRDVCVSAGLGSSAGSCIRRIETSALNTGNAITRAISATVGNSYTINQSAIYDISYFDSMPNNSANDRTAAFGVSLNAGTATDTAITSLATAINLVSCYTTIAGNTAGAGTYQNGTSVHVTRRLSAGAIIRPHTGSNGDLLSVADFSITKIGL